MRTKGIGSILFKQARKTPDIEAIRCGDQSISYNELNDKALSIATVIAKSGLKNQTIGIVGKRNFSVYMGILGSIYAGCSYTPINPNHDKSRIANVINECSIQLVIGCLDDLSKIHNIINENSLIIIMPNEKTPYSGFHGKSFGKESIDTIKQNSSPIEVDKNSIIYILYTSGSTGRPKGVKVTYQNVLSFLKNMNQIYSLPQGFRSSHTFDLSFDLSVCDMFFTWSNSGTLCVLPEEEKLMPSEYIRREKISFWYSVPTLASFMDRFNVLEYDAFPSLKYSLFCGEPLPHELAVKWSNAALNSTVENVYGPTEATIHLTRRVYSKDDLNRVFTNGIMPIGKPFSDHEIEIINRDGNKVSYGDTGEIVLKGPQITQGYLNDVEKTKSAFVHFDWDSSESKWYKSGDFGFYNTDGDLECLGRKDNQIKIGGQRIEIGEIEGVLRNYELLNDVVIVPVKNSDSSTKTLVGFITTSLSEKEEQKIRLDSQQFLERIFFPRKFVEVKAFPTSDSGKVDKKQLLSIFHSILH